MTRLVASDIDHIAASMNEYEADLLFKTGQSLKGLACNAAGMEENKLNAILPRIQARIVPVTWGEGLIPGFTAAVESILKRIGLTVEVTRKMNIAGIEEAVEKQSDLIFISDDDDFIALNCNRKKRVHNSTATGKGFAAGLDLMAGGISGRDALVIGCGPVGSSAALELRRRGARVTVYDQNEARYNDLPEGPGISNAGAGVVAKDIAKLSRQFDYIFDATPAAGLIGKDSIGPRTFVAAPGMPIGLTPEAVEKAGPRLLHDPLQIGVATMAIEVLSAPC